MSGAPLVELASVTKRFREGDRDRLVLSAVDLTIDRGAVVAVVGRSGSGKSTLLNLIGAVDVPTAGDVRVAGESIVMGSEHRRALYRRRAVGFVFQFFNLIPTLTAGENVSLPLELGGMVEKQARRRAQTLLDRVGLANRMDDYPDRLSGGEQQRVAIARALAHQPPLILADEPTGNLDEETGQTVLAMLLELVRESGRTMIMATHSLEILPYADHVFRVTEGHLVEERRHRMERRVM